MYVRMHACVYMYLFINISCDILKIEIEVEEMISRMKHEIAAERILTGSDEVSP